MVRHCFSDPFRAAIFGEYAMRFKLLCATAALALTCATAPALAGTVDVTFTPFDLSPDSYLNAVLTFSNVANPDGSFNITGITGTVGSDTITTLIAGGPGLTVSADGAYDFDNLLLTPNGFDNNGPLWMDSAGNEDNLYLRLSDPQTYNLVRDPLNYAGGHDGIVTFSGGSVPEPASWALMILDFGGIGAKIRSVRRKQELVTA
jgi:hypothetical protein